MSTKLHKPKTIEEMYLYYLLTKEGEIDDLPKPSTIGEQYLYQMCIDGVKVVGGEGSVGTGAQGPKGDKGDPGEQGIQGIQGPIGATGPQGTPGVIGPKGEQGIQGVKGNDGALWTVSSVNPVAESGKIGDFHLNTSTWTVHNKREGGWVSLGSIKGADGTTTVVQAEAPQSKTVKYLDIVANTQARKQNYLTAIYNATQEKATKAEIKYVIKLKQEGTVEKPLSIGLRLFANNDGDKTVIAGAYNVAKDNLIQNPEYDTEYTVKASFDATGGGIALNSVNYLKPFLMLNKVTDDPDSTNTQALEVYEAVITVNGKEHDILNTVDVWGRFEGEKTTVEEKEKEVTIAPQPIQAKIPLPWEGKTYNIIGDSIVYGLNGQTGSGRVTKPHPTTTGELCGFTKVNNYGISSSTITTKPSDAGWNGARNPMVLRYNNMEDADVIGFAGGINDYWLDVPLGTFDPSSEDTTNFYGGLNVLFKGLITKYPTKTIFALTVLDYDGEGITGSDGNANGNTLQEWRNAVKTVAQYYSIPVFDIGNESGMTTAISTQMNALMPDGLHPNQAGYDILGRKIAKFINYRL